MFAAMAVPAASEEEEEKSARVAQPQLQHGTTIAWGSPPRGSSPKQSCVRLLTTNQLQGQASTASGAATGIPERVCHWGSPLPGTPRALPRCWKCLGRVTGRVHHPGGYMGRGQGALTQERQYGLQDLPCCLGEECQNHTESCSGERPQ